MNELYDKSEINLEAAIKLHEAGMYDAVCHPSYYSCLQLMSHKLISPDQSDKCIKLAKDIRQKINSI